MKATTHPTSLAAAAALCFSLSALTACDSDDDSSGQSTTDASGSESSDSETTTTTTATGGYPIVDTGQALSFDDETTIDAPAAGEDYYGQDAQFAGNQPSYTDNGDGTITDNITGLMWQQSAQSLTVAEALAMVDDFELAGYGDWRIPTVKEAYSLINFSGSDPSEETGSDSAVPFIDTDYFDFEYAFNGTRDVDTQLYTSTEYAGTVMGDSECNFGVNIADGRIKCYGVDNPSGEAEYTVRLVRGGSGDYGQNNFQLNEDEGTVSDLATSLMWTRGDSGEGLNWKDALAYAQDKNAESYLGYSDWRLPNAKELQSIVDYTRSLQATNSAAIDEVFECTEIADEAGQTDYPFYWTSTTHKSASGSAESAVYIAFGEALGYYEVSVGSSESEWMDVHGAGAQRADPKAGDPDDYPEGDGPQGDAVRIYNYVRLVRDL